MQELRLKPLVPACTLAALLFLAPFCKAKAPASYDLALKEYRAGNFSAAAALLSAKRDKNPGEHNLLGWAYLKAGSYKEALAQFNFSISLDSTTYNSYCGIGYIHYRQESLATAAEYFKKGIPQDSDCVAGNAEVLRRIKASGPEEKKMVPAKTPPAREAGTGIFAEVEGTRIAARASGRYFEIHRNGRWEKLLIKGINIGASVPGHWFGELVGSREQYLQWMEKISAMNANVLRVYTLLNPDFYHALYDFNQRAGGKRLWLMQEIWPPDTIPGNNLFDKDYDEEYRKELAINIDALTGKASIPVRPGRAYGEFNSDISPYLLGILVGREITTEEAAETNKANPDRKSYYGKYVQTVGEANALEVWLAETADFAQSLLQQRHRRQVPVGFVSWPTLDPMRHPTEFSSDGVKNDAVEDSQTLTPDHLRAGPESKAGFFGAYHIYPYYPDFMYREQAYSDYSDSEGIFQYGGYLRHFMNNLPDYPAVVAEFGIPTSLAASHIHPYGLSQGAIEEKNQGKMIGRMMRAIVKEGYAGGIIFEWADEWAKRSWATMTYMVPFERHIYWHNMQDAEQNFGLMADEPAARPFGKNAKTLWTASPGTAPEALIKSLSADKNEEYLYLRVQLARDAAAELAPGAKSDTEFLLALDTIGRKNGTVRLPLKELPDLPTGSEFLLRINSRDGARLLARPDYNRGVSRFAAEAATDDAFEEIVYAVSNIVKSPLTGETVFPAIYTNDSRLFYGVFTPEDKRYNSLSHWYLDTGTGTLYIRLPWALLNFGDPSSCAVLLDTRTGLPKGPSDLREHAYGMEPLNTEKTTGLLFYSALTRGGKLADYQPRDGAVFSSSPEPYIWQEWTKPDYRSRLKLSYREVQQLYKEIK